jgi:hypothetical protein
VLLVCDNVHILMWIVVSMRLIKYCFYRRYTCFVNVERTIVLLVCAYMNVDCSFYEAH